MSSIFLLKLSNYDFLGNFGLLVLNVALFLALIYMVHRIGSRHPPTGNSNEFELSMLNDIRQMIEEVITRSIK